MNILHIAMELGRGGLERLICDLAKVQIQQGHQIRVLTVYKRGDLAHELVQSGAIVDCCDIPKENWRRKSFFWSFWLRNYLRQYKIDAVIEHCCLEGYVAWPCASAGVLYMVPVIHNTYGGRLRFRLHRRLQHRVFLNRYSRFIAVSESVREFEINHYAVQPDRISVIPNGIVISKFHLPTPTFQEKQQLLGVTLKKNAIIVGTVGNLRAQKNHELLLCAWRELVNNCSVPLKLIIVGEGNLREELEKQRDSLGLTDNVFFLGMRSDIPELLKCFDIFVMSSRHEGHPVVSLEAMAASLPVVATNVSGLRDVVRDGVNGFLVEPENPRALADGLKRLIFDVNLRKSVGQAGRQIVEEEYSIQQCARLYEKALLESPLNAYHK